LVFHSSEVEDSSVLKCDTHVAWLVVPDIWKECSIFIFKVKELQEARLLDPELEDTMFL